MGGRTAELCVALEWLLWVQNCPKRLGLPASKSSDEHTGRIVPAKDINGSHGRTPLLVSYESGLGTCRVQPGRTITLTKVDRLTKDAHHWGSPQSTGSDSSTASATPAKGD